MQSFGQIKPCVHVRSCLLGYHADLVLPKEGLKEHKSPVKAISGHIVVVKFIFHGVQLYIVQITHGYRLPVLRYLCQ